MREHSDTEIQRYTMRQRGHSQTHIHSSKQKDNRHTRHTRTTDRQTDTTGIQGPQTDRETQQTRKINRQTQHTQKNHIRRRGHGGHTNEVRPCEEQVVAQRGLGMSRGRPGFKTKCAVVSLACFIRAAQVGGDRVIREGYTVY